MDKVFVYPQLPNAGLGNMLLVWARAILFAEINSLPVIQPNWFRFKIGTFFRKEKSKRYYGTYFSNKGYISKFQVFTLIFAANKIYEHPIETVNIFSQFSPCIYIFRDVPHWSNYFVDIKEHHHLIREKLRATIYPKLLCQIDAIPSPEIGIHVRLGDYRKLQSGENFANLGSVRTPIKWYVSVLQKIRELVGYIVPATVFSDGYDHELHDLLQLPQVIRYPHASAISDIFTLSKSKLIITSAGSTFSSWASYLGQSPTIWHPAHFHSGVFPINIRTTTFEGVFDPEAMAIPDLLKRNILSLFNNQIVS